MTQAKIAIIGGGPGGLTLARLLHLRGVAATIYERDAHEGDRPQGGTLDLHAETGQRALGRAGLTREFLAVARYEDQGVKLYDSAAHRLFASEESEGDRPEVDRTALRRLLIRSLPEGAIRWGAKIERIEPVSEGRHRVWANGVGETYDLVVGADGAWSCVRPLLSNARPFYEGVTLVEFGFDDVGRRHPDVAVLTGRGKMFALGRNRALVTQLNGHAHVRGYFAYRVGIEWAASLDGLSSAAVRDAVTGQLTGWAPALAGLICAADQIIGVRSLHALPIGHCWAHRPGLTLIGDAAHLMSPFGGEGVNLAMADAAELAEAIADSDDPAAIEAFEGRMAGRVAEAAAGAAEGLRVAISPDGAAGALAYMLSTMGEKPALPA